MMKMEKRQEYGLNWILISVGKLFEFMLFPLL